MLAAQPVLKNCVVFAILVMALGGLMARGSFGALSWSVIMGMQGRKENPDRERSGFFLCPEQDSNLHANTRTTPSRWRVYQFHHLGKGLQI